jgi:hypothetical protein
MCFHALAYIKLFWAVLPMKNALPEVKAELESNYEAAPCEGED